MVSQILSLTLSLALPPAVDLTSRTSSAAARTYKFIYLTKSHNQRTILYVKFTCYSDKFSRDSNHYFYLFIGFYCVAASCDE